MIANMKVKRFHHILIFVSVNYIVIITFEAQWEENNRTEIEEAVCISYYA